MRAEVFFEAGLDTGEGPLWDGRTGTLLCVDSTNPAIWRFSPEGRVLDRMSLPERIGFAALTDADGVLVCGLRTGLHRVDLGARSVDRLMDPEPDLPGNRINDGVVDLDGSLIFGSLDDGLTEPTGLAWQLTLDGALRRFDDGYVVSNGPYPHPDGERVLFIDSVACAVKVFRRRPDGGLTYDGPFCDWDEATLGLPDGCVCDTDGGVWIAHWGGACVTRWSSEGEMTHRVDIPCSQVTKPAFGGADMSTLYVTSANRGIDPGAERLAGSLFAVPTAFTGIPARPCAVRF
jgi:sugar lactone lactonase YvrE